MARRRLLAILGALGLVAGLLTSGVAAQADTSMSDSDFNAMVSTYLTQANTGSTFCRAQPATTTDCPVITQESAGSSNNVAICVENDHTAAPPTQFCSITQTNTTRNNIAIVIQIVNRSGNDLDQNATQDGRIHQNNLSGHNFAAVLQFVKQSTRAIGAQSQTDNQGAAIEQNQLTGAAASGHNLAILGESSKQTGYSQVAAMQTQFSNEDANTDPHHINQTSTGLSIALATQSQVQELFGSGLQDQTIDPRCCSIQQSNPNDRFTIRQFASQRNNHQVGSTQHATSVAQCSTSGSCTTSSTTTQNGVTTTVPCGPEPSCSAVLVCTNSICPVACSNGDGCNPPSPPCFPGLCDLTLLSPTVSVGNGAVASALRSRSQPKPLARSASSAPLLT
jgi:hypothetical protein